MTTGSSMLQKGDALRSMSAPSTRSNRSGIQGNQEGILYPNDEPMQGGIDTFTTCFNVQTKGSMGSSTTSG